MLTKTLLILLIFAVLDATAMANVVRDFDGDRRTDLAVGNDFSTGPGSYQYLWHVMGSRSGYSVTYWGAQDNNSGGYVDDRMPADFDGDGKTDIAVWRQPLFNASSSQCYFYILHSSDGTFDVIPWGLKIIDTPVPADYDGDGKADPAIARSTSNGIYWWILQSHDGLRVQRWGGDGVSADIPVPADYDGDGKTDLTIIRYLPPNNIIYTWYILRSSDGNWMTARLGTFGSDDPCIGDYDGDGKADICVVGRRGDFPSYNWRWISSRDGGFNAIHWGQPGDQIVQGDYDGDGKTDQAIYRRDGNCENFSNFWINGSSSGPRVIPFGGCSTGAIESGF